MTGKTSQIPGRSTSSLVFHISWNTTLLCSPLQQQKAVIHDMTDKLIQN